MTVRQLTFVVSSFYSTYELAVHGQKQSFLSHRPQLFTKSHPILAVCSYLCSARQIDQICEVVALNYTIKPFIDLSLSPYHQFNVSIARCNIQMQRIETCPFSVNDTELLAVNTFNLR